jgi:glycosyltransferase involved in cell wall biosynthesis
LVEQACVHFQSELHAFVKEHGLQDMVTFTGHLDVSEGALDGLDIFVHASTEPEPFGMVLLEAMAKKKAILASAEGGPLEILSTGMDGLLIPPRQPELLADHIRILACDPDLRRNLGDQAEQTVVDRFNADVATRKLEVYYEELM